MKLFYMLLAMVVVAINQIKTDKDEIKNILEQYEEERKAKLMAYQEETEETEEEEDDE